MLRDNTSLATCARLVAALLLGISLLSAVAPLSPLMPEPGLDPSWMQGLNVASSQHMAFGSGIRATFGPYASLFTHLYHPLTDGLTVVLGVALAAVYLLIALVTFRGRTGGRYLMAALFFALATLDRNILFFALPTLLALTVHQLTVTAGRSPRAGSQPWLLNIIVVAGGVGIGLLCLSKGSMVPYSWVLLAFSAGWLAFRKQGYSAVLLLVAYAAAIVLFWLVAGQSLADLPSYFTSTLEIVSGYTDAMSVQGPTWEWTLYLVVAVLTLLLLGTDRLPRSSRIFFGLVAGACYFFCFKAGFTRHDGLPFDSSGLALTGHFGTAALALLLIGLCSSVFLQTLERRRLGVVLGLLGCGVIIGAYGPANPVVAFRYVVATQIAAVDGIRSRLAITPPPAARYAQRLALIRKQLDLPATKGGWDLYSYDQSLLLAHEVPWKPRPAFQSYFAYTPNLLQANATHLQSNDAPDNIVFQVQTIDYRYPAQDDGLSWPYLMGLYAPTMRLDHGFVLLERRPPNDPQRRAVLPAYLPAQSIRLGQRVEIPAGVDLRYARLKFSKTLVGKAMSVVYKAPILMIQVELASGHKATYRLIPGITEAGFLLSPAIDSSDKFAFAATGQLEVLRPFQVVAFTLLTGENGSLAWHDEVKFSLSAPIDNGSPAVQ